MYPLPIELQNSYRESSRYPENLIPSGIATYNSRLSAYKKRLDDAEVDLCLVPSEDEVDETFEIPMIDLQTGDGKGKRFSRVSRVVLKSIVRDKRYIHTPAKLTDWLGVTTVQNTNDPNARSLSTRKKDPKCRFMYDQLSVSSVLY